jgi:hypothetical protein
VCINASKFESWNGSDYGGLAALNSSARSDRHSSMQSPFVRVGSTTEKGKAPSRSRPRTLPYLYDALSLRDLSGPSVLLCLLNRQHPTCGIQVISAIESGKTPQRHQVNSRDSLLVQFEWSSALHSEAGNELQVNWEAAYALGTRLRTISARAFA